MEGHYYSICIDMVPHQFNSYMLLYIGDEHQKSIQKNTTSLEAIEGGHTRIIAQ